MRMSAAWPPAPPLGWCSRKRVLGREKRFSLSPPSSMGTAMLATQPAPMATTGEWMNLIMSWMAKPASTWPPGDVITTLTGSCESASSTSNWPMTFSASVWLTVPETSTVRDISSFASTSSRGRSSFFPQLSLCTNMSVQPRLLSIPRKRRPRESVVAETGVWHAAWTPARCLEGIFCQLRARAFKARRRAPRATPAGA